MVDGTGATTYVYDAVGNRLSKNATAYIYDAADRLTAAGGTAYAFDNNGNQTGRGADTFGWDAEDRLTSATVGGATTSFAYNGDGLRDSLTVGLGWQERLSGLCNCRTRSGCLASRFMIVESIPAAAQVVAEA